MRTRRSAGGEPLASLILEKKATVPKISTLNAIQDQTKSTLLGLPPDLRNIIYELYLPGTCEIPNASASNRHGCYQCPSLLITCKQAYAEGINIFYRETAFRFCGATSRMSAWLSHVASRIGHGAMLGNVTLVVRPMTGPHAKMVGICDDRIWLSRDRGVKFVDFVGPTAKRANVRSGVLKIEFRPCPQDWSLYSRQQGSRGDPYYEREMGALQTWALIWDESGKAKMVRC